MEFPKLIRIPSKKYITLKHSHIQTRSCGRRTIILGIWFQVSWGGYLVLMKE